MKLEKVMRTENGQDETRTEKINREKKLGGLKTLPFILANEVSERFATTGFQANMITYLTQQLNMPVVKSSNIVTNFNGTAGFTPLIGALIADSLVGRFWMVILGSIIYELGFGALILSAVVPGLRPPPCPSQTNCKEASSLQASILYISILFTALGLGGMRPCLVTFAADQFDMTKSKTESRKWNLFNWYCFFLEIGNLMALTILVYIQDNVGWGWGLGIPAIVMAFSVIVFVSGTPFYKKENPKGSPLVRLAQVIVASIRKRKVVVPDEPGLLFESKELDAVISSGEKLIHTNGFQWLDKAAVITEADREEKVPNLWRLSTVHRVEELKSIVRMLPIWSTGILAITAYSHQDSFNILMGRTMDRHLTPSFEIPAATMLIFENLAILIGLPLYERLFVPFARKFTKNPNGITYLQRMGIGFTINIVATLISAFMEIKRKSVAAHHNLLDDPTSTIPMSVFWLVPQYSVHGLALVFITTGRVEFFYNQSPESMRSTSASFFWIALALGQYSGTYMVSTIHDYTAKGRDWIPNRNLNRGRLEYYFLFVSGLQVVNLAYFFICSKFYTYKAVEEVTQVDVELSMEKIGANTKEDDKEVIEEIIKK